MAWALRTSGTSAHLFGVAYGNGVYVIVGAAVAGQSTILISSDAIIWSPVTNPGTSTLKDVIWNGTLFVAVGDSGTVLTSPTGAVWTVRNGISITQSLTGIAWSGTKFVTVGLDASKVGISPDGIIWTEQSVSMGVTQKFDIVWAGAQFVVVGEAGDICFSTDAITWTLITSGTQTLLSVEWNGGQILISGTSSQAQVSNDNGVSWAISSTGVGSGWGATWSGTQFVVVGEASLIGISSNGISWAQTGLSGAHYGVLYNSGLFIIIGASGEIYTGTPYDPVTRALTYLWGIYPISVFKNLYYSWSINPSPDIAFLSPNRFHIRRGAMFMDNIKKTVYETFPIVFEFDDFILTTSESIASYIVTCVNTATGVDTKATMVLSDNNASPKINVIVQAGAIGETHKITVSATTNFGNVYELDCTLDIVETRGYDMFMKQPGEKKTLSNDFTKDLAGDTIASSTITATKISDGTSAAGVLNTSTNGANAVIFGVQAGDDGEFYAIAIKIVSALGYKYQKDILMNVRAV